MRRRVWLLLVVATLAVLGLARLARDRQQPPIAREAPTHRSVPAAGTQRPVGIEFEPVPATLIRYEVMPQVSGKAIMEGYNVGYLSENAYCVKTVRGDHAIELHWIELYCVDRSMGKLRYRNGNVSVRNLQPPFAVDHAISAPIPRILTESIQPLAKRLFESDPVFIDEMPIEPRVSAALLAKRLESKVYRFVTREPCGDESCVVVDVSDQQYLFYVHEGQSMRYAIRERDGFVQRISTLDSHGVLLRVIEATSIRPVGDGFGDLFAMPDGSKVYTLTIATMRGAVDPEMENASDRIGAALLAQEVVRVGAVGVSGNLYAKTFDYAYPPLPWTSESPAVMIETYRNHHGHTVDVVLATPGIQTWPFWNDAWFTTRFAHRSIIEMNFETRDHRSVIVWESSDAACGADMTMLLTSEHGSDILPESAIFQEWKGIVDRMTVAPCAERQD